MTDPGEPQTRKHETSDVTGGSGDPDWALARELDIALHGDETGAPWMTLLGEVGGLRAENERLRAEITEHRETWGLLADAFAEWNPLAASGVVPPK